MQTEMTDLERAATGPGGVFYGVYPAKVVTTDRDKDVTGPPGYVQVALPMFSGEPALGAVWARVVVPMAGDTRGTYFMPEVDDEVLVAFEAGNVDRPYVVGALWNGEDKPPVADDENNDIRTIVSRSGLTLQFDDTDGGQRVTIATPGGAAIVLDEAGSKVEIVDGNGNKVLMESGNVSVEANAKITLTSSTAKIETGTLQVDAGLSNFSGVVKCDTLITNSVVSPTYTHGRGNRI